MYTLHYSKAAYNTHSTVQYSYLLVVYTYDILVQRVRSYTICMHISLLWYKYYKDLLVRAKEGKQRPYICTGKTIPRSTL